MELIKQGSAPVPALDDTNTAPAAVRTSVVDSDSGFTHVLAKRLGAVGWRAELLPSPPPVEELAAMRLDAIVIDPPLLGGEAWSYLGRLCAASAGVAVLVCTG